MSASFESTIKSNLLCQIVLIQRKGLPSDVLAEVAKEGYCTFDLNWQPGPWKARISISPP